MARCFSVVRTIMEEMRHGADEVACILPDVQRLTLAGQDHGPDDEVLVPALRAFFIG
jgi:hypothetical protein